MKTNQLSAVLFDLDGTLTDPLPGFIRSIRHALLQLGDVCPDDDILATYIGPPLRGTLRTILPHADDTTIETAVAHYRERLGEIGIFENEVYEGIPAVLETLKGLPARLFVATGKPVLFAARIVEHFGLAPWFNGIYGAELDGRFEDKGELLAHIIAHEGLDPERTAMVGDRRYDVIAAKQNGVLAVGVTYGYGSEEELREAGADVIVGSPVEIVKVLGVHAP